MTGETRSILAIDSNASVVFYLKTLLSQFGYDVVTARSAEEALRVMQRNVPFLVLTELDLPKMNAISLLNRMHRSLQLKSVPVVILTANTDPGMKDTCLRAGCADYVAKPFEPDTLYQSIQSASESSPRRNIRLVTSFTVIVGEQNKGNNTRTEYATAISEGGIYIRTLYPLEINAVRPLILCINDRKLSVKAVVLYTYLTGQGPYGDPGMGLKFIEITDNDRLFLREFINRQVTHEIPERLR